MTSSKPTPPSSTFKQWLACAKVTDDPVGDFVTEARNDPLPDTITSRKALHDHLQSRRACQECLDTVPEVWARFRQWEQRRDTMRERP